MASYSRLLIFAMSISAGATIVQPPMGIYGVASTAVELIDNSRQDPYAAAQGDHVPRRLMVSLFSPATLKADCDPSVQSYMPPATAAVYDAMYDAYGLPSGVFGGLQMSFCQNNQSSGQEIPDTLVPTVLFSPGLGNSRLLYSGIAQSLASRGFTVITIDHPYDAPIVEYPDGSKVLAANITTDEQITFDLGVRVADTSFVLDQLDSCAVQMFPTDSVINCTKSIAPRRYLMYGHSLGGATAVAAMSNDSRLIGAVNLDGTMFGPVLSHGVACPMMLFAHPNHTLTTDSSWNDVWKHSANATRLELVLEDSAHGTFTDFPLLVDAINLPMKIRHQLVPLIGALHGKQVDLILSRYLDAFFEYALGASKNSTSQSSKVEILQQIEKDVCI